MVELAEIPPTLSAAAHGPEALRRERLRMAGACLLGAGFGASILPFFAVGAALGPMMLEFDWTAGQVRLAYGLMMWAGALGVWPMGVLVDRLGARPVAVGAAGAIGLVSLLLPLVHEFCQLGILIGMLGVLGAAGLAYTRTIASLFGGRRGLALGALAAEASVLGMLAPLAMGRLVSEGGWRGAFTVVGVAMLALAPILYVGLTGRRTPPGRPRWTPPRASPETGMTALQAIRQPAFWIIVAAGLATALMGSGVLASFGAAIGDKGFAQTAVFRAAPITLMAALAGAICSGAVLDRSRSPRVAGAAYLATAFTYLLWWLATPGFGGEPMLIAGLAIGAFAFTAQLPLVAYFFSRYFGLTSFATVCGVQACLQAVCVALAGPALARGLGLIGDYHLMLEVGIGAQILAALLYLLLPPYRYAAIGEGDADDPDPPRTMAPVRSQ